MVDLTPAETRIRKQCNLLARRILKADGEDGVGLAVGLLKRARNNGSSKQSRAREVYAFLIKNGIDESTAWAEAGMAELSP